MRNRYIKGITGIVLILCILAGIYYWETIGRKAYTYEKVIVLKEDINKNERITKDNLTYILIENGKVIENHIKSYNELENKYAKHYIPKNLQLCSDFFISSNELKDKKIFKIPSEYILTFPGSLRKFDDIEILGMSKDDENKKIRFISKTKVFSVKDNSNREVTNFDNSSERDNATSSISDIEIFADTEMINTLLEQSNSYNYVITYDFNY